ncbi:MAG: DDE-type integrase/transposase/recombinase [Actinobacteria bacterium]|nr:DDE-type integrase/transposase/recombinase [Actinomycetota bacterium]
MRNSLGCSSCSAGSRIPPRTCGGRRFATLELPLYCFHMVLGHSREGFCALTGSQDLVTFWACHRQAFRHFGGIPKELLYDRTRTVVRQHVGREVTLERRIFHPEALASAHHDGFCSRCGCASRTTRVVARDGFFNFDGRRYCVPDATPGERVEIVLGPAELEVYSTTDGRRIARHERGRPAIVLPDPVENSVSLATVLDAMPTVEVHRRPLSTYQKLIDG